MKDDTVVGVKEESMYNWQTKRLVKGYLVYIKRDGGIHLGERVWFTKKQFKMLMTALKEFEREMK